MLQGFKVFCGRWFLWLWVMLLMLCTFLNWMCAHGAAQGEVAQGEARGKLQGEGIYGDSNFWKFLWVYKISSFRRVMSITFRLLIPKLLHNHKIQHLIVDHKIFYFKALVYYNSTHKLVPTSAIIREISESSKAELAHCLSLLPNCNNLNKCNVCELKKHKLFPWKKAKIPSL